MSRKSRKAIFLDRDNTLIQDTGYIYSPGKVKPIKGAPEALRKLMDAGFLLIVVSNQSGIGRGYFKAEDTEKVNARMEEIFSKHGVVFDAIFYCPHAPEEGCTCRKPRPGMLKTAAKRFNIDLKSSVMIGDKPCDVEAGIAAGCKLNILLAKKKPDDCGGFAVAKNFTEALQAIEQLYQ